MDQFVELVLLQLLESWRISKQLLHIVQSCIQLQVLFVLLELRLGQNFENLGISSL
jgi:hypothetical protein